MRKAKTLVLTVILAIILLALTNPAAKGPAEVRGKTILSMRDWADHPTALGGCGGSDCCVAPAAIKDCEDFGRDVRRNATTWAHRVEAWYTTDAAASWTCNQETEGRNRTVTYCNVWPADPDVLDAGVAIKLSELSIVEAES
jgi:hypothetical protein